MRCAAIPIAPRPGSIGCSRKCDAARQAHSPMTGPRCCWRGSRHNYSIMARLLRYRAVLFDLDGTLVDSYAALADAVNFARGKYGLGSLTTETIREFVGEGLERLLCR